MRLQRIVTDRLINILVVLCGVVINFVVGISCCVFAIILIESVFVVCYARVRASLGGPMQLRSCGYLGISAGPTAVRAECCHSACLLASDIGITHDSLLREAYL